MWPSGRQTRVARPLAAKCSTCGGGRSDLGDLVTGGGRPSGCTGERDARVREAVRLCAASDPRVRRGGAGASAPRGVSRGLRGAGGAAAGVCEGGARRLRGLRGLRARLRADLLPQLRRRAAGALLLQIARLLSLVHGPADGRVSGLSFLQAPHEWPIQRLEVEDLGIEVAPAASKWATMVDAYRGRRW